MDTDAHRCFRRNCRYIYSRIHGPRERDCCFMPFKTTGGDWLALSGKRVCLSRDRQASSSGFGAYQQEALHILAPAICVHLCPSVAKANSYTIEFRISHFRPQGPRRYGSLFVGNRCFRMVQWFHGRHKTTSSRNRRQGTRGSRMRRQHV